MIRMKKIAFLLSSLLSSNTATVAAESYPAPPGVYGNEALFKELEQQTGAIEQPDAVASDPISDTRQSTSDVPLIFIQPAKPKQTALNKSQTESAKQPSATQTMPPQTAQRQNDTVKYYQPATQPVTADYIPDASQLNQKMHEAAKLEFDQWGQALQNYPTEQPTADYYYGPELFNQSTSMMNDQLFDNPYPVQRRQQNYQNQPQSHFSINSQSYPVPTDYNNLPETPSFQEYGIHMPSANQAPVNYGSTYTFGNDNLQQGYNQSPPDITHYTKPSATGNRYNRFDQQRSSGQFGNQQYFHKIPEDDIIYPPHYPGYR